jgi:hypothetical protein
MGDEFLLHGEHRTPSEPRRGERWPVRALRFLLGLVRNSATTPETQLQQAPHEVRRRRGGP